MAMSAAAAAAAACACALCQQPIYENEPRSTFHAIRAYLYKPLSQGRICKDVLQEVSFRGMPWDPATTPPNEESSDPLPIHNRCQATIRRAAKRKGVNAPGTKRSAVRSTSAGRKRKPAAFAAAPSAGAAATPRHATHVAEVPAPMTSQLANIRTALNDLSVCPDWSRLPAAALSAYMRAQAALAEVAVAAQQHGHHAMTVADAARGMPAKPVRMVAGAGKGSAGGVPRGSVMVRGDITPPQTSDAGAESVGSPVDNNPEHPPLGARSVLDQAVVASPFYTMLDVDASAVPVPAPAPVAAPACVRDVSPRHPRYSEPVALGTHAAPGVLGDDDASAVESLMDLATLPMPKERRHSTAGSSAGSAKIGAAMAATGAPWPSDASFVFANVPNMSGSVVGPASLGYPASVADLALAL